MSKMRRIVIFITVTLLLTLVLLIQLVTLIIYENDDNLIIYKKQGENRWNHVIQGIVIIQGGGFDGTFNENDTTTRLADATTVRPIADRYDDNQTCKFPILDAFDRSILKFVEHPKKLQCRKLQPYLTYARSNTVFIDRLACLKYRCTKLKMRTYLMPDGDLTMKFGNWTNLTDVDEIDLSHDGIEITANYQSPGEDKIKYYSMLYANVNPATRLGLYKHRLVPNRGEINARLNVVIFGIDSLSRSNFIRNLPKTYKVLTMLLDGWLFRGYSKIDDNTFPNMMALLSGYKVTVHDTELPVDIQGEFVDAWPIIWRNYTRQQYVTLLSEEQPGIFNYKAKGFKSAPTDIYLRALGKMMVDSAMMRASTAGCFGNEPESMHFLATIKRFIQFNRSKPHFIFSFLWRLSHDHVNQIEVLDEYLAEYFDDMTVSGLFDESIVIVMSDHGNRFDHIRSTLVGRVEERMPFLFMHFPRKFLARNPLLPQILNENVWRLTCQFDVYETLVDILKRQYGADRPTLFNRGISLFRPIPLDRTCEDVSIAKHFCVCQQETALSIDQPIVIMAVDAALITMMKAIEQYKDKCASLHVTSIVSASLLDVNDNVTHNIRYDFDKILDRGDVIDEINHIRVVFRTEPNQGVYEASVEVRNNSECSIELASISRINTYGHDGDCMSLIDRNLEKFCYCIAQSI